MKRHLLYSLTLLLAVGISGTALAQGTPAGPGDVVINKVMNKEVASSDEYDAVELLITGDHVDLRGCFFKDFSSDATQDNGGKLRFSQTSPLLSDLRAGTIIVLTNGEPSTVDTSYDPFGPSGGDWVINVSILDAQAETSIFPGSGNPAGFNFHLGNDEILMVMPNTANGLGVSPLIHAFIVGNPGSSQAAYPLPTLRNYINGGGDGDTLRSFTEIIPADPGNIAYANSPTTSYSDFTAASTLVAAEGADVEGVALAFGTGNTDNNRAYIDALRQTVLSVTPPFAKRNYFELAANPSPVAAGGVLTLNFTLQTSQRVSFDLVDLSGKKVAQLQGETQLPTGEHEIRVSIPDRVTTSFGVYFIQMHSDSGNEAYAKIAVYR